MQYCSVQYYSALISDLSSRGEFEAVSASEDQRVFLIPNQPHSPQHQGLIQQLQVLILAIAKDVGKGVMFDLVTTPPETDDASDDGGPEQE